MATIGKFDAALLMLIHDKLQNNIFDKIMPVISFLGNMGMIWIAFSIVLLVNRKYRKAALMIICALILTSILGEGIIKNLIQRPRPFTHINVVHLLVNKPTTYSFPSGHTASSFAVMGIVWRLLKKVRIPVLIIAGLIAFSRMYLLVHYPLDILGGAMLGVACSKIVLVVFKDRILQSEYVVNQ